jgi:hypothetical protein
MSHESPEYLQDLTATFQAAIGYRNPGSYSLMCTAMRLQPPFNEALDRNDVVRYNDKLYLLAGVQGEVFHFVSLDGSGHDPYATWSVPVGRLVQISAKMDKLSKAEAEEAVKRAIEAASSVA